MRLQELSLEHMIPFIAMIGDYKEGDPETLARLFPTERQWDAAEFRNFMKIAEAERLDWKPGPNRVSKTRYVLMNDEGQIAGHAMLIFPLDDKTVIEGGNIRFTSPPSHRGGMNEVHTLNRMLFEAVRAGLARALATCFEDDQMRRLAIEMNRGELEEIVPSISDPKRNVCRYWLPLR